MCVWFCTCILSLQLNYDCDNSCVFVFVPLQVNCDCDNKETNKLWLWQQRDKQTNWDCDNKETKTNKLWQRTPSSSLASASHTPSLSPWWNWGSIRFSSLLKTINITDHFVVHPSIRKDRIDSPLLEHWPPPRWQDGRWTWTTRRSVASLFPGEYPHHSSSKLQSPSSDHYHRKCHDFERCPNLPVVVQKLVSLVFVHIHLFQSKITQKSNKDLNWISTRFLSLWINCKLLRVRSYHPATTTRIPHILPIRENTFLQMFLVFNRNLWNYLFSSIP